MIIGYSDTTGIGKISERDGQPSTKTKKQLMNWTLHIIYHLLLSDVHDLYIFIYNR